ncbi:MAG: helix-turn-helix domain-containing protein [Clostridia bacterium]|nr:helix-turn-helix domain-containing protein [Clostridia bacterium]MBQ7897756.1 helix-turn-helix domain-containing protein [Clostridia bacterium]
MVYSGTYVNPRCDRNAPLSFHACGGGLFGRHFSHGPTVRDEYIIHYIINGQGYLETPYGTFHYSEGDIFCIYPGEVIKYYTGGVRTNICFVNFVGTEAGKIYESIGITHEKPVASVNSNSLVNAIYKCLNYGIETENPSEWRLTSFLLEILSYMESDKALEKADQKKNYINRGIAFMEYNFDSPISVEGIAAAAGIEKSYFYKIFVKEMGISPIKYLTDIRINKAKALIKSGIHFKAVATAVGINDIYYFSKLFTKSVGMTPSEYRKKIKKEIEYEERHSE